MNPEELQQFFSQLPPELQQKVMMIEDEQKRMTVLASLYQRYLQQQGQIDSGGQDPNLSQSPEYGVDPNQLPQDTYSPEEMGQAVAMKYGGRSMRKAQEGLNTQQQEQSQYVPVEAERNESVFIPTGETPYTEDGFLEPLSTNPITGASNYEIPKDRDNQSHEERNHLTGQQGINMELPEGSVVYSDKTKLPYEFKIGKRNFEGKTFKAAADYVSKLEKDAEKKIKALEENGELDDIAQQTFEFNFAKYGKYRQELNDLQETVLDLKKQTEVNEESNKFMAQYGANIKKLNKANENYLQAYDQYSSSKSANPSTKKVLKARDGLNASIAGMDKLMADMQSNPDLPVEDLTSRAKMYGLMQDRPSVPIQGGKALKPKSTIEPFAYTPASDTLQQFKQGIIGLEAKTYSNPYVAMSGISEQEAASKSYKELIPKAASSAVGAYQFLWNTHKRDIKKVTGIEDPDEFRYNPAAQEQFMDWYTTSYLMPTAIKLKQKYQMPFNIYQIMGGIHLEGESNFVKKYKANQLNKSTMAGGFKNMDTQSYMQQFAQFPNEAEMRYGGSTKYAEGGEITPAQRKQQELEARAKLMRDADNKVFKQYFDNNNRGMEVSYDGEKFFKLDSISPNRQKLYGTSYVSPTMENRIPYFPEQMEVPVQVAPGRYNDPNFRYGGRAKMYADNGVAADFKTISNPPVFYPSALPAQLSPYTGDKQPPGIQPRYNQLEGVTEDDLHLINEFYFQGKAKDNKELQGLLNQYSIDNYNEPVYHTLAGKTDENRIADQDGRLGDDWETLIKAMKSKIGTGLQNKPAFTAPVPGGTPIVNPRAKESTTTLDSLPLSTRTSDASGNVIPITDETIPSRSPMYSNSPETPQGDPSKPNWLQYLNYGVNKSLPALDALSLMMEKTIPPTLQQKRARYTPLSTDVDINPQLNEAQRLYASTQADTRGNPSVRAARLAQINANAQSNMNQTLAQKYNMEQQLRNQEVMRADQYYNQLDDVNMGLRKRYETEMLQTAENKRQQSTQARQYLMNLKLREEEQNKAMKLALMNTNYDYDPITGEFRLNPTRQGEHFTQGLMIMKAQTILKKQQDAIEQLRKTTDPAERKSLEERMEFFETQLAGLNPAQGAAKKKLGGKVKAKTNPQDLMPTINYKKYFPM